VQCWRPAESSTLRITRPEMTKNMSEPESPCPYVSMLLQCATAPNLLDKPVALGHLVQHTIVLHSLDVCLQAQ
jgi:hypothetical protein